MKTTNIPAGSQRVSQVGLVWEEKVAGGAVKFRAKMQSTVRVHAIAQTTVSLDGVAAITLEIGETEYINVGSGKGGDSRSTVEVDVVGSANVSIAREEETGRRER
jgi:hypothetical protein